MGGESIVRWVSLFLRGGFLSGRGKYEARGKREKAPHSPFERLVINAWEKGVSPFLGRPYLPAAMLYRESVFGVSKNMRPKLDRCPMYVRYPNKSDTLKGIPANMPPVKTCHSSLAGNGCYVGRFLMAAF